MENNIDDSGNHSLDFESLVDQMVDVPATDGHNKEVEEPVETKNSEPTETIDEGTEDELDSILDEITGENDGEAGEDQEKEEETTEESSEEPDDGQETFKYKYDGEEYELTAKEVHELKKDAGRGKALTQKEQKLAENRKQLEAEAQAVAFAKAKPEVRELTSQIQEAEIAVQRGFTFELLV